MATIGEQIIAARKAKGMTQDALSRELNISRSAVAHWETGRTMPDAATLLELSRVLDYSFDRATGDSAPVQGIDEYAPDDWPEAEEDVETEQSPDMDENRDAKQRYEVDGNPEAEDEERLWPAPESPSKPIHPGFDVNPPERGDHPEQASRGGKKRLLICVAAILALAICAALLLPRLLKREESPRAYAAEDGSVYTIEQFQQPTPREDGKAWLLSDKGVKIISSDGADVWMYEFNFHEMNGVGLTIDRLEVCTFYGDKVLPMIIPGNTLSNYGLAGDIAPKGDWKTTGGLPVSDNVKGVGIALVCTDDNGQALSFCDYLALSIVR